MEMGNLAAGTAIFLEGHTSELKVSGGYSTRRPLQQGTGVVTPSRQPPARGGLMLVKKPWLQGLPWWPSCQEYAVQCRGCAPDHWSGTKIPHAEKQLSLRATREPVCAYSWEICTRAKDPVKRQWRPTRRATKTPGSQMEVQIYF